MIEHVIDGCTCSGKRCPRCERVKCYGAFHRNKSRRDGVHSHCKTCINKPVNDSPIEPVQLHVIAGCTCPGKRCTLCEQVKCHGAFYSSREAKSGLRGRCRTCINAVDKARCDNDRTHHNAKRREQYCRKVQSEHGEFYRQINREKCRKYYTNHPEYFSTYERNHPEAMATKQTNRRARKKQAGGSFTSEQWKSLKAMYDYTCLCCGKREPEIRLTADHVVPLVKGGSNAIDNIQPLCFSCNCSKQAKVIDYRKDKKV